MILERSSQSNEMEALRKSHNLQGQQMPHAGVGFPGSPNQKVCVWFFRIGF